MLDVSLQLLVVSFVRQIFWNTWISEPIVLILHLNVRFPPNEWIMGDEVQSSGRNMHKTYQWSNAHRNWCRWGLRSSVLLAPVGHWAVPGQSTTRWMDGRHLLDASIMPPASARNKINIQSINADACKSALELIRDVNQSIMFMQEF